jgi:UDP-N-acetylmuramoyl-tripeptide--D-alanyl-D-alanine ligase
MITVGCRIKKKFMTMWREQEVSEALDLKDLPVFTATGVSIDTRTLNPGDLFVAIQGERCDGHDFIEQALKKGAVAALVHKPACPGRVIMVPDTFKALEKLALAARKRFAGKILALTGSVGKTTIKEGLSHSLSSQKSTFASQGSFNNALGLALSLARLPREKEYGVFELGMNHAGEIESLVSLLSPHVTMVTNVSYQHGENFSDVHEIVRAKGEIFSSCLSGVGIIGRDLPHYEALKALGERQCIRKWITFGSHQESHVRLVKSQPLDSNAIEVTLEYDQKRYTYTLPHIGDHWVMNSLALIAGCVSMSADIEIALQGLAGFQPVAGRGQVLEIKGITVIDESYNAAPEAMMAALRSFAQRACPGKKHVVLGEMRELGAQQDFYHDALYEPLMSVGAQSVWLCGSAMKKLSLRLPHLKKHEETIDQLIPYIVSDLSQGDMVLIKGARGTKTFKVVDALYRHHGEVEKAESYPLKPYLHI